jgi:hypothetical protein
MSPEVLPVVSGLALGTFLGWARPALGKPAATALILLLAVAATVASGEFRLSWGFVLVDITMVAVPACASFLALRRRWVRR